MSFDLTNKNISDTFQNLLQKTGSDGRLYDLEGNVVRDLTIDGTLTANTYITSESIVNTSSGSTAFGNSADDTHLFTGHITASGNISASGNFIGYFPDTNDDASHYPIVVDGQKGTLQSQNSLNVNPSTGQITVGTLKLMGSAGSGVGGHITASGDISSSGTISASKFAGDGASLTGVTAEWDGTHTGTATFTGNITASGNISSSGTIYGGTALFAGSIGVNGSDAGSVQGVNVQGSVSASNGLVAPSVTSNGGTFTYTSDQDGGDTGIIIRNTNIDAGTDKTTSLQFSHMRGINNEEAGKIVSGKEASYNTTGNSDSFMAFYTTLDGDDTEYMRILSSGNVGIGTNAPTKKLQVQGDISSSGKGTFDTINVKSSITGSYPKLTDSDGEIIFKISGVAASMTSKLEMGDVGNAGMGEVLILDSNSENPVFYNTPAGPVKWGINNNPQNSIDGLTVAGGISASGDIYSQGSIRDITHITASGNISGSSSTNLTIGGVINAGNATLNNVQMGEINAVSNITASGNISASGTIQSSGSISTVNGMTASLGLFTPHPDGIINVGGYNGSRGALLGGGNFHFQTAESVTAFTLGSVGGRAFRFDGDSGTNIGIGSAANGSDSVPKTLTVGGDISASGHVDVHTISASANIYVPNIGAGVDNSVVVLDSDGTLKTDEIDSRVWGSTLLDDTDAAGYVLQSVTASLLVRNTETASFLVNSDTGSMGNLTVEGDISGSGALILGDLGNGSYISASSNGEIVISGSGDSFFEIDGYITSSGAVYVGTVGGSVISMSNGNISASGLLMSSASIKTGLDRLVAYDTSTGQFHVTASSGFHAGGGGSVSGDTFATDLKIGRDSQNLVDFASTDNKIIFRVNDVNEVELVENALSPVTSDGVALGTTSLQWSDVFLAEGGVINFDNGDVTITQTGNNLAIAGGSISASGDVRVTGTVSASGDLFMPTGTGSFDYIKVENGISASGTNHIIDGMIETDQINALDSNLIISTDNGGDITFNEAIDTVAKYTADKGWKFSTNITASGDISASGQLIAASAEIPTIKATDLYIGEDNQTGINFETANEIHFDVDNSELVNMKAGGMNVAGTISASSAVYVNSPEHELGAQSTNFGTLPQITSSFSASAGKGYGDIVSIGTSSVDAGRVYCLDSGGETWTLADADGGCVSSSLLGVSLAESSSKGMLLRGFAQVSQSLQCTAGQHIYASTHPGSVSASMPQGTGDVVRILGYALNSGTSNMSSSVYFNPDSTWVVHS